MTYVDSSCEQSANGLGENLKEQMKHKLDISRLREFLQDKDYKDSMIAAVVINAVKRHPDFRKAN